MNKSGITIASTAGVLLVSVIAYYVLSPFVFLRTLASDVRNGNPSALAQEIDSPSVRAGLDDDLDGFLAARAEQRKSRKQDVLQRAITSLLPSVGYQVINSIVTPDGIAALLRQHVKLAGDGSGRPSLWEGHLSWLSPHHVRVTYVNARHPELPFSIELERQRIFSWRVSRLDLPIKEMAGFSP